MARKNPQKQKLRNRQDGIDIAIAQFRDIKGTCSLRVLARDHIHCAPDGIGQEPGQRSDAACHGVGTTLTDTKGQRAAARLIRSMQPCDMIQSFPVPPSCGA